MKVIFKSHLAAFQIIIANQTIARLIVLLNPERASIPLLNLRVGIIIGHKEQGAGRQTKRDNHPGRTPGQRHQAQQRQ